MTVGRLALIYSPWIAVSFAALVLAFLPGAFASRRERSFAAGAAVVLLAYPFGVLNAPAWFVATVYFIPAGGAVASTALAWRGISGSLRARAAQSDHAPDADRSGLGGAASHLVIPRARSRTLRPSDRLAAVRGAQYGALIAVVVVLALMVNWEKISRQLFTLEALGVAAPRIFPDFLNTLKYTFGAFGVSLSLGLVLALMKLSGAAGYRALATAYIEFFRGLPALIVVFAVAYGIPLALEIKIPTVALKAAIALGCVSAAYMAESIRAGIQAVPKGQIEAARSLGMSHSATLRLVVIPQAFRIVLPPVTNEIILLTKDTSLVYVMGLTVYEYELSKLARETLSEPHGGLTALFAISACYLVITLPLGFLVRRMEKGFGKAQA
ncbi:MAG: amino acid ABC transporter permease [Bifidobacteriaceae bacterium]|jgi:polar amino acid transport system permease protein|nr:amino acid ABC transporter permease [Bifidobacteriaceae bacterium]